MNKIKVFTSSYASDLAGTRLTEKIETWQSTHSVEIISQHTNSNNNGWMVSIMYKQL